jgi:hypothetical protein
MHCERLAQNVTMPPEARDRASAGKSCSTFAEPVKNLADPGVTGLDPARLILRPPPSSGVAADF